MPFRGRLTALVGEDSNKSHHPQAQQHHATYSHKSILQHDSMTPEKDSMTLIKGGIQKRCLYDTFGNVAPIKHSISQNDKQLARNKNGMKQAASLEAILPAELLLYFLCKNGIYETRCTVGSNGSTEEKDVRLRSTSYHRTNSHL